MLVLLKVSLLFLLCNTSHDLLPKHDMVGCCPNAFPMQSAKSWGIVRSVKKLLLPLGRPYCPVGVSRVVAHIYHSAAKVP